MANLTDRERILVNVVRQMHSTMIMKCKADFLSSAVNGECDYAHFSCMKKPSPGDLVLAQTGGDPQWKIGWYVEPIGHDGAVIREIGGNALCNYTNESFHPLVGMHKTYLLEGEQYKAHLKVLAAFRKGDEHAYRYGGVDFEGDEMIVTVREWHGGFGRDSHPFKVRMKYGKKTTVKSILANLRAGGYGSADFSRPRPEFVAP